MIRVNDAYFQDVWEPEATALTVAPRQGESLMRGVYENVLFHYTVVRNGITETLDLPIAHLEVP